jgi:hypothetical protein
MKMYDQALTHLYQTLGLVTSTANGLPLHLHCEYRESCWRDNLHRTPPADKEWAQIYLPWIGSKYEQERILVVGENMNECGGLSAARDLMKQARCEILKGKHRVFGSGSYRGSMLWYNLGYYSLSLLRDRDEFELSGQIDVSNEMVAGAYDLVAFTNHVKCSPIGEKSEPTPEMWNKCGIHILSREISILAPRVILLLGVQENMWFLSNHVFTIPESSWSRYGCVNKCAATLGGAEYQIFAVPHPSYFKAKRTSVLEDLLKARDA